MGAESLAQGRVTVPDEWRRRQLGRHALRYVPVRPKHGQSTVRARLGTARSRSRDGPGTARHVALSHAQDATRGDEACTLIGLASDTILHYTLYSIQPPTHCPGHALRGRMDGDAAHCFAELGRRRTREVHQTQKTALSDSRQR